MEPSSPELVAAALGLALDAIDLVRSAMVAAAKDGTTTDDAGGVAVALRYHIGLTDTGERSGWGVRQRVCVCWCMRPGEVGRLLHGEPVASFTIDRVR